MITFKRDSWHYKLATRFGNYREYTYLESTICGYWECVLWGITKIIGIIYTISIAINIILLFPIEFILNYFGIVRYTFLDSGLTFGKISMVILGVLISLLTIVFLFDNIFKNVSRVSKPSFTFISVYWQSIKEKYCILIKFE